MHGCSEGSENTRPFLHVMGASDYNSTMSYGLSQKHLFGVVGSTDHHSGHPGSYGHGRTAVWADRKTREAIWQALCQRRTYALTGDRISLQNSLNDQIMREVLSEDVALEALKGEPNIAGPLAQILIARALERIGDQACNICDQVPSILGDHH